MFVRRRSNYWLIAAAVVVSLLSTRALAAAGQSLEISPPLVELNADPGKTVTTNLTVRNTSSEAVTVSGTADDFAAKGEDGEPQILFDETEATSESLKFWVQPITTVTLKPKEAKSIPVTIIVPANAEPGGHYGVVRFTGSATSSDRSSVALSASIGSLVLLRVNGPITHKVSLASFVTEQSGVRRGIIYGGSLSLVERLTNDGTLHIKPSGTVTVRNWLGHTVAGFAINSTSRNVLPHSTRRFNQDLASGRLYGRYTATATVTADGTTLTKTISFWVIPVKLLAILLGGLALMTSLVIGGLKLYKRRILAKYSPPKEQ